MTEKSWSHTHGPASTHYSDCWKNHIYCALHQARELIQFVTEYPIDYEAIRELREFLEGTEPEPLATLDSSTEQETSGIT